LILKILLKSGIFYMSETLKKIKFFLELFLRDIFNFEKINLFIKVFPYTMVGYKRLSNVYELVKKIRKDKIEGDFVECGVWKGGCSAVMGFVAEKERGGRKTWLFDSFEGLPEPTKEDGKVAIEYSGDKSGGRLNTIKKCVGPMEDVRKIFFEILKIKPENVVIKKGWFQDTLPVEKEKIGKISILRLDGDWYESTRCCLENLYKNVIIGGYIVIDDYGHWEGARKALDEFFIKEGIKSKMIKIDCTGVFFKKS